MSLKQSVKKWAEAPLIKQYEKKLATMRGNYAEWLARPENRPICDEAFFGRGEGLARYFEEHPEAVLLYGDEDCTSPEGKTWHPWFKPDWSPELLESCFYLGSLIAVRRDFLEKALPDWRTALGQAEAESERMIVFLREDPDEPYWDTILRLCKMAGGWARGCRSILHLPGILHHCSLRELPCPRREWNRKGLDGEEREEFRGNGVAGSSLSVVIPSKDNPEFLEACIGALRRAACHRKSAWQGAKEAMDGAKETADGAKETADGAKETADGAKEAMDGAKEAADGAKETADGAMATMETGPELEIIVVDNGSSLQNREKIERLEGIRYLYEPMEFNFAKMCNLGAGAATGEYLLFLNDDVELLPESHLEEMLALASREGVGSVGLKLLYPNSVKLQHAGITNLPMGPVHKLQFLKDSEEYYYGMNRGLRNVLAVTAACVMLRTDRFREAGGFDESLQVAFNDVALGFRLYELGYRNVCMCDAHAYHHESLSRGEDESPEKLERLLGERKKLYALFPRLEGRDPYYGQGLGRRGLDVRVRPAYVTMHNERQEADTLLAISPEGCREDSCLSLRIEDERDGEITGYLLVLGDDNACYERKLILRNEKGEYIQLPLEDAFRPDLEENLPDQRHVALSGFWIHIAEGSLPAGSYRIGGLARRKVGRLALLGWTNRRLIIP